MSAHDDEPFLGELIGWEVGTEWIGPGDMLYGTVAPDGHVRSPTVDDLLAWLAPRCAWGVSILVDPNEGVERVSVEIDAYGDHGYSWTAEHQYPTLLEALEAAVRVVAGQQGEQR